MTFSKALKLGSALLRRNLVPIFATGLVSYLFIFGVLFAVGRVLRMVIATPGVPFDPTAYWHSLPMSYKLCWLAGFVLTAWTPQLMTHAAAAWTAAREVDSEPIDTSGAVKAAFSRIPALVVLALLIGIPATIGFVLVLPGLIFSAIGVMIVPEMIIWDLSLGSAIRSGIRVGWKHARPMGLILVVIAAMAVALELVASIYPFWILGAVPLLGALAASWLGSVASAVCVEHQRKSVPALVET